MLKASSLTIMIETELHQPHRQRRPRHAHRPSQLCIAGMDAVPPSWEPLVWRNTVP